MKRDLVLECTKCNKLMKFDFYIKEFICSNCNNRRKITEIAENEFMVKEEKDAKKMAFNINFTKDFFLEKIKKTKKTNLLIPDCFNKDKNYKVSLLKTFFLPLINYQTDCLVYLNDKKEFVIYNISNMLFDNYANFKDDIIKRVYPLDLEAKQVELKEEENVLDFKLTRPEIYQDVQNAIKNILTAKLNVNPSNLNFFFLKEDYQIFYLPLYLYPITYKNKEDYLVMNANTGKSYIVFPIANFKLYLIIASFLFVDIILFIVFQLLRTDETMTFNLVLIFFLLEFLLICLLYFYCKNHPPIESDKNKFYLKKRS